MTALLLLGLVFFAHRGEAAEVYAVNVPATETRNSLYVSNRAPLTIPRVRSRWFGNLEGKQISRSTLTLLPSSFARGRAGYPSGGWKTGSSLPSPVVAKEPVETVTLIPMGCARLRISAFSTVVPEG